MDIVEITQPPVAQFTREELIASSSNLTLTTLQQLLPRLEPGWALVTYGTGNSFTDPHNKQISINHCQILNNGLRDLAWEITNAINTPRRIALETGAKNKTISEFDFVMGIHTMEAEAQLNAMKTASQLGYNLHEIGYSHLSISTYDSFISETITLETFIHIVANEMHQFGKIKNSKGLVLMAREEYANQYRMFFDS
jgi:hypothetical protein